jgi:hypothetical protein
VLLRLLTLPVTGPAQLGWWVLDQIIGAAEAELYSEERVIAAMRELNRKLEDGLISEEEHAAAETVLVERLMIARAYRQEMEEPR